MVLLFGLAATACPTVGPTFVPRKLPYPELEEAAVIRPGVHGIVKRIKGVVARRLCSGSRAPHKSRHALKRYYYNKPPT